MCFCCAEMNKDRHWGQGGETNHGIDEDGYLGGTEHCIIWKGGVIKGLADALRGAIIINCHLSLHSKVNICKILSRTSFPALEYLHISSPFPMKPSILFLHQHRGLKAMGLFGIEASGTYLSQHYMLQVGKASMPTTCFPCLSSLQLSADYCTWLSAFDASSILLCSMSLVPNP